MVAITIFLGEIMMCTAELEHDVSGQTRPWPADRVERWPIEKLIPYANNPRINSEADLDKVAASICKCGVTMPPLVGGKAIYDPFLGSGTSLIAAEMTGRVCDGLELDPSYVDVTVRRWQLFTGRVAVHQASGQSFDERTDSRDQDPLGAASG